MVLKLIQDDIVVLQHEYYSVGGGFIYRKGQKVRPAPQRLNILILMKELKSLLQSHNLTLSELMYANEIALTGAT
jgi:L-serine dehydratase